MSGPHLSIRGVSKTYDGRRGRYTAIEDVNLDVDRGEVVSIVGHSGCGKSTVLSIVAGLSPPTSGEVLLGGMPITGPGPDRGVVFQHHALLPWLSVYDNVRVAVDCATRDEHEADTDDRVERVLRMVKLWEHRDKKPGQMSGGMKQRTSVARAFALDPEMLLLDEPFGALDALTRSSLQDELIELWGADLGDRTIVLVTHDIDEAILLSDRVVVMTNGPEATIGEIVPIQLPRPRDRRALVYMHEYAEEKDHLLRLLTQDFRKSLHSDGVRQPAALGDGPVVMTPYLHTLG